VEEVRAGTVRLAAIALLAIAAMLFLAPATDARRPFPTPPRLPVSAPQTGLGSAVDAANGLMALPWGGIAAQYAEDGRKAIVAALSAVPLLAHASGSVSQIGAKWGFDVAVDNPRATIDLSAPPGYRAASLRTAAVNGRPGFSFEAPLGRFWSAGAAADLTADAFVNVAGQRICCGRVRVPFGLEIRKARFSGDTVLDSTDAQRPRLVSGTVRPQFELHGTGALPFTLPVAFSLGVSTGPVTRTVPITNLSVGLAGLSAKLTGRLTITLEPSRAISDIDIAAPQGIPASGHLPSVHATFPNQRLVVSLTGRLSLALDRVGRKDAPFSLGFSTLIPSTDQLNRSLDTLRAGLPIDVGGVTPPAPWLLAAPTLPDSSLATVAGDIERAIATHIPFGGVLSIDAPRRPKLRSTYGLEADSSIWTGHYLAAESFRYAATHGDPAALARVKELLAGIQRLFDVTQDAVAIKPIGVTGARTRPASELRPVTTGPGIFSRTARPSTSAVDYDPPLDKRPCAYEAPEGGWRLHAGGAKPKVYRDYRAVDAALSRLTTPALRRATVSALGTIWYGWGCGKDHPISRDQYIGLLTGLTFANRLVTDPDVQSASRRLIVQSLDYLLAKHWNVVLPPDNRIETMFLGNTDLQLAALRIGATVDPAKYGAVYAKYAAAAGVDFVPRFFSILDPIGQYYKFNLATSTFATTLTLESDPAIRAGYTDAYDMLWRSVRGHRNAWFDLVHVLVQAPAVQAATIASPSVANPALTLGQEIRTTLGEWADRRSRVLGPNQLPRNDLPDPGAITGLWPDKIATFSGLDGGFSCQARFALGVNQRAGNGMDFVWQRSPFGTSIPTRQCGIGTRPTEQDLRSNGAADPRREGSGVDYLLAYWLSAYLGVVAR
jgi:hypothetical protein